MLLADHRFHCSPSPASLSPSRSPAEDLPEAQASGLTTSASRPVGVLGNSIRLLLLKLLLSSSSKGLKPKPSANISTRLGMADFTSFSNLKELNILPLTHSLATEFDASSNQVARGLGLPEGPLFADLDVGFFMKAEIKRSSSSRQNFLSFFDPFLPQGPFLFISENLVLQSDANVFLIPWDLISSSTSSSELLESKATGLCNTASNLPFQVGVFPELTGTSKQLSFCPAVPPDPQAAK
nr:hypothetical protein Iba_chr15aCG7280 [Ipomoea batatas]